MFDLLLTTTKVIYDLKSVKVAVLKDLGKLPINSDVSAVSRGQEVELPRWLAKKLSELGVVEVRLRPTTPDEVGKYLISEKSVGKSSINKLRDDFYYEVKELLSRVKSSSVDADSAIAAIRLESNLRDFIRLRMNKIISLTVLNTTRERIEGNLTIEELVLFKMLNDLLSSWLNQLAPKVFRSE